MGRSHSVRYAVIQFLIAGLLALAALSIVATLLLRQAYRSAEREDAKGLARTTIRQVVEAHLSDGVLQRDPFATGSFDQVIRASILNATVRGLTLIQPDGQVVYSDIPTAIGTRIPVPSSYVNLAVDGAVITARADDGADDAHRAPGLFEVVQAVAPPGGRHLFLESYMSLAAVNASASKLWISSAPAFLGTLVLFELVQLPLAVSLARRVRDAKQREEDLLRRAIESSATERRRIAADLHDGVVQDLAAANFGLTAAAEGLAGASRPTVDAIQAAAASTRKAIGALRTLLVEIYPPNLDQVGLVPALRDLCGPLPSMGIESSLSVPDGFRLPAPAEAIMFRTAQEALRNVVSHAGATHVAVTVTQDDHEAVLTVSDDGHGFRLPPDGGPAVNGHLGLRLLADLASDAGARLTVASTPEVGTEVRLEVPV